MLLGLRKPCMHVPGQARPAQIRPLVFYRIDTNAMGLGINLKLQANFEN